VYSLVRRVLNRVLHVSDLHRGKRESPAVDAALRVLAAELEPVLVVASGDLANRGRAGELERARSLLASLGAEVLAVPGNHDIPYTFPARFTRPWQEFERVLGPAEPVHRSERLVAVGLCSVRPWRQQGGRLRPEQLRRAAELLRDPPPQALRLVVFHHHLAWAPWRGVNKLPLKRRDEVLATLAAAGAELVAAGHIHQSTTVERRDVLALEAPAGSSLVLATAPGLGRPRPRRTGEAHGLHVYEWDERRLAVVTYVWDGSAFEPTARREFARTSTL
jgi:3',5'-cyclic AMP phosphodiesterase CpdA